jgi:hypothetical protein
MRSVARALVRASKFAMCSLTVTSISTSVLEKANRHNDDRDYDQKLN